MKLNKSVRAVTLQKYVANFLLDIGRKQENTYFEHIIHDIF